MPNKLEGVFGATNSNFLFPMEAILRAYQRVQEVLYTISFIEGIPPDFEDYWDTVYDDDERPYDINISTSEQIVPGFTYRGKVTLYATLYQCHKEFSNAKHWTTNSSVYMNLIKIPLELFSGE